MASDAMASMGNFPEYMDQNVLEMRQNDPQEMSIENMGDNPLINGAVYPEVHFKLKPHIDMACDLIGTYGSVMPTQGQLEQLSDGILDDFCDMYPDMADYMHRDDPVENSPSLRGGFGGGFSPGFGSRFRRRGLGRDLVSALLLAELVRRGFYY